MSTEKKQNKKSKKNTKKKIIYIDDGRSFADFSNFSNKHSKLYGSNDNGVNFSGSKFKDSIKTYFESVKLMLLPMLVMLGFMCVLFLLLWIIFVTR